MTDWIIEQLRLRLVKRLNRLARELAATGRVEFDDENGRVEVVEYTYEEAIAIAKEATEDDETPLEPLREYLRKEGRPELAGFIKSNRGRHDRRHDPDYKMTGAKEDIKSINTLWFQTYGFRRRPRGSKMPRAEDIAAELNNVILRSNKSRW